MNIPNLTQLPIEQKVGQLFFIGIPGPARDDETARLLNDIRPGGVCLFTRNIRERSQTRDLLDSVAGALPVYPFLSLDQEGGLVDRLRRVLEPMPAPDRFHDPDDVREFGKLIAEAVRTLGFNMDFAPVVDVIDDVRVAFNNGLHSRAFGSSVDDVVELSGSFLNSLQENGCLGCLKHFPGLGAAEVDSHEELPLVNIADDTLSDVDLRPYRRLFENGTVGMVMVAHAAYPNVRLQETGQNGRLLPSSLSSGFVTSLLRDELGFNGVAVTDDLEMGAIVKNYGMGDACKMAIRAGEDMLAICAGVDAIREGFDAVLGAVRSGEISEDRIDQSLGRIAVLKSRISLPPDFSDSRLDDISRAIIEIKDRLK